MKIIFLSFMLVFIIIPALALGNEQEVRDIFDKKLNGLQSICQSTGLSIKEKQKKATKILIEIRELVAKGSLKETILDIKILEYSTMLQSTKDSSEFSNLLSQCQFTQSEKDFEIKRLIVIDVLYKIFGNVFMVLPAQLLNEIVVGIITKTSTYIMKGSGVTLESFERLVRNILNLFYTGIFANFGITEYQNYKDPLRKIKIEVRDSNTKEILQEIEKKQMELIELKKLLVDIQNKKPIDKDLESQTLSMIEKTIGLILKLESDVYESYDPTIIQSII